MDIDAKDCRLEGDRADPQATFWTKATHLPTGVVYQHPVGFMSKRQLMERLQYAVNAQQGSINALPMVPPAQSDEDVAEMIARFRTPPGFSWEPLRDDIVSLLKARCGTLGASK